jgi:OsmC-like protein
MKPLPHQYDVRLTGGPAGYATLSVAGVPDLRAAPPLDFDGPGDAWSPEHLLLAAVETCFLFTLRAVAQASRIEFTAECASPRSCSGPDSGCGPARTKVGRGEPWRRPSKPAWSPHRSPSLCAWSQRSRSAEPSQACWSGATPPC